MEYFVMISWDVQMENFAVRKFLKVMTYSNPWIYMSLINVVSIYVVKFFVSSNFNLRCHSIYVACFWNQLRRKPRDYCKFI